MSDATAAPARPAHVVLTNDQHDRLLAAARLARTSLANAIAVEQLPRAKAWKRTECDAYTALIDILSTPRCTIVTPPARRPAEETPDAG